MGEEVEWNEFISKFKPVQCKVVEGKKLVCEGVLDDKNAVCEITEKDGKHQVTCTREPTTAV
jgi:hypothetical protein